MNTTSLTTNLSEFLSTLRARRLEMSLTLEQAQAQYGGPHQASNQARCEALGELDAMFADADAQLHARQQQALCGMKEQLERVECAVRLLEENGPHAQLLAYQALTGGSKSAGAVVPQLH